MAESYLQVTTTIDSAARAAEIARHVVENRLAACAQVLSPIKSTYWWQGEIETAEECMVFMKTSAGRVDALIAALLDIHSYDVPEVVVTPIVGGNPDYMRWIGSETAVASGPAAAGSETETG
jgi:periplasmic divalent cation tolerance protein